MELYISVGHEILQFDPMNGSLFGWLESLGFAQRWHDFASE